MEDAPAEAIRLAAAELALRVQEERRRREAGLQANPNLQTQRMTGKPSECLKPEKPKNLSPKIQPQEEKRWREAGLQANPNLQTQRMTGKPSECRLPPNLKPFFISPKHRP